MDEGVIVFNDFLTPVLMNAAARRILGVEMHDLPARVAPEELASLARRALVEQHSVDGELQLWTSRRTLRVHASPLDDGGGVLVVLRDVTEELLTHQIRRQFVANASHELKTPVAGIQALAETVRDAAVDDPPAAARFAQKLVAETERLGRLVQDLLDLSRLEDPTPIATRSVDLSDVVASEVDGFSEIARERALSLEVDLERGLVVRGDDRQLGLMVRNLLDNAVRYTHDGGTVSVSLRSDDNDVVIEVADTGEGIPLQFQTRVFERFFRVGTDRARATGGTGLGLALVKHVAELHGGHVTLRSELGEGSTFTVRLPVGER